MKPGRLFRLAASMYGLLGLAVASGTAYALYVGETALAPAVVVTLLLVIPCAAFCVYLWAYAAAAPRALRYAAVSMGVHLGVVAVFNLVFAVMLLVPAGITFLGMHRCLRGSDAPGA